MIRVDHASREYGDGPARTVALEDVDLAIAAGELVAVAGPSGSGKTTLLHLIGGLDHPTRGRILLDDEDLAEQGEDRLSAVRRMQLGFVFQNYHLVPVLSAAENVELPLLFRRDLSPAERRERVRSALARVGLERRAAHRPAALSGGEQQRVAIARAVAGGPDIVLADEPTANLDHATGGAVIGLLAELNRENGTTVIYATHDPELIRLAGRVVRLRDGRQMSEEAP